MQLTKATAALLAAAVLGACTELPVSSPEKQLSSPVAPGTVRTEDAVAGFSFITPPNSVVSLAGDEDNFGYGGTGTAPCAFYSLTGANDLGIFDRELTTAEDDVDNWTHNFAIPAGAVIQSVFVEIRELFSDAGAATITVDGVTIPFQSNGASGCGPAKVQTFSFVGAAAQFAADGLVKMTFRENGDHIALDWSRITIVLQSNSPPTANAGGPYTGNEGAPIAFNGAGTDPDGDALTYSWNFGDGSVAVAGANATHTYAQDGNYTATLTVTDGSGASDTRTAAVTVNNVLPTIHLPAALTVESGSPLTLNGAFTDPGAEPNFQVFIDWGTNGATTNFALPLAGPFTKNFVYANPGTYTITVKILDGTGASGATTEVTVTNRAPTAVIAPVAATLQCAPNSPIALDGSSSSDVDGSIVAYNWTVDGAAAGSTANITVPCVAGVHNAKLEVEDNSGAKASATVTFEVLNAAPVARAGNDQAATLNGATTTSVTLDGSASTDDGHVAALTYVWKEGSTVVGNSAVVSVTLGLGTHTLTLTVNDGQKQSSDDVVVTVTDPSPPSITSTVSGTEGNNGWYRGNVTIHWTVTDLESPSTSCADNTLNVDVASQTYTCTASSAGGPNSADVTVKRDATNPVIVYSGALNYTIDQTVAISCVASDALSGVASDDCAANGASGPAYGFLLGPNVLTAHASDNAGNAVTQSATFTVSASTSSLCALVRQVVSNNGVANSLCSKLDNAAKASNANARSNMLNAFINEVQGQSGKQIPADKAAILINLARTL